MDIVHPDALVHYTVIYTVSLSRCMLCVWNYTEYTYAGNWGILNRHMDIYSAAALGLVKNSSPGAVYAY